MEFFDEKTIGPPTSLDWNNAFVFSKFLKIFYDCTLELFGSNYVTSNNTFPQLALIQTELRKWSNSNNLLLNGMVRDMKLKFDKYYGNVQKFNTFLYIVNVLDQRYKLAYLK